MIKNNNTNSYLFFFKLRISFIYRYIYIYIYVCMKTKKKKIVCGFGIYCPECALILKAYIVMQPKIQQE